jgi:hypothetical protein
MPPELGQYRLLKSKTSLFRKAFPVQSSHTFAVGSAVFDEPNLVSAAGLVPIMELAEQTGLSRLIGEHVDLPSTRVASGAVNPAGKLTTIIAGMMCGADSIDDVNVLRAGGTPRVFDEVYAPSTLGIMLREFTFGHANQLAAVAREHLAALAQRTPLLPGIAERAFLDIDSLLRPVYGHHKQGATFGHAKIAGRALLRKGLSPLITTLSVPQAAPVIAEAWLRSGKTGSGRGAARQVKQAVTTTRGCGVSGTIMLRGDSAFGTKKVIAACLDEQIEFSVTLSRNKRVTKAIDSIDETEWIPVHYPGAVLDPDTGALISDAEAAETGYTQNIRGHGRVTARLGAPRERRPLPGCPVPGVAVSPVCHQLRVAHRRSRHNPPPPRHHRDHLRRPDQRAAGAHPIRALRRQLRLAGLRGDRAQSAACRRDHRRRRPRRRARRHPAPGPGHRARPLRRPRPQADVAPARALAMADRVENPVGHHHRLQSRNPKSRMNATTPAHPPSQARPGDTWKAGAGQRTTHAHTIPNRPNRAESAPRRHDITDPRIQAKQSPPDHWAHRLQY